MSKTIIEVKCFDQALTLTNTPVIASGGVGEDYVSAEFCEKWNGFAVSLLFWRQGVDPIPVLADADGLYQVPAELTTADGVVYFGAVGVAPDGVRRTSEGGSYRIQAGAITENTTLPVPDGDVFTQLLAQYADIKLYVADRADVAVDAAARAAADAQACRVAAEEAEQHAEDAVDAVEDVIYPGIVEAVIDDDGGTNSASVTLSKAPPDKMILTFRAPFKDARYETLGEMLIVNHFDADGNKVRERFWLREANQTNIPANGIAWRAVVTVLLVRLDSKTEAYVLNPRITQMVLDKIADASWRTVTFIPYDGTRHTLAEAQVNTMLELPVEMDLTRYNYEYEVIAFGLTMVGGTSYNTNLPTINLCMDEYKNRITSSLFITEEMEGGLIPECGRNGLFLEQGWLTFNHKKYIHSGHYFDPNGKKMDGFATARGSSSDSDNLEFFSHIQLTAYAVDTAQTYGLAFRYRPIPKE